MNFKKERSEVQSIYTTQASKSVEDDIHRTFLERKWVWVPDKKLSFIPGYIVKEKGEMVEVDCDGNIREFRSTEVMRMNPPKFDMAEDLASLSHLNEPSVLYNLTKRYKNGLIYTYSGLFLLAINPYRNLSIYSQKYIKKYTMSKKNELDPHIFAVANEAYSLMISNRENQSVLITGESGAGKTENTKKVIEFLASVAGYKTEGISIDKKIIDSNPILEAFGNAKTVKNDNSSRFGKFIQIKFNGGNICGANIEKYLLEKSRITGQNESERNYHIFYQLIFGAEEGLKKALFLDGSVGNYRFLRGGCHTIENVDDVESFKNLRVCMRALDISEETELFYYKIVAAVLHLGNLEFRTNKGQVEIVNLETVEKICKLLKISSSAFIKCLIHPVIKAGHEVVTQHRTVEQVYRIVEALAKILYDKMFDLIILNLNRSLGTTHSSNFIGVLDIAGFEIFKSNSFEQLCINYTNEKLQQFFNHHMFILEQEIYRQEDIDWDFIDFGLDLQPTIDLIESSNPIGIMAYLDEECVMPGASDRTFLEKLLRNIKSDKFKKINFKEGFRLQHYAGDVEYEVNDWITKNKDPNFESLTSLINMSEDSSVSSLSFSEGKSLKKGFFRTVSQRHKEQLLSLMKTLSSTSPHFVRCIIPNLNKTGERVESRLILEQLKCNGVLEGIRISRQGFPSRMKYSEFVERYKILSSGSSKGDDLSSTITKNDITKNEISNDTTLHTNREITEFILKDVKVNPALYRLGKTKVFFRQSVLADIEDLRDIRVSAIMREVQGLVRAKMALMKSSLEEIRRKSVGLLKKNASLCVSLQKWNWWKLYLKIKPLLDVRKRDNEIKSYKEEIEKEKAKAKDLEKKVKDLLESRDMIQKSLEAEKQFSFEKDELMKALRKKSEESEIRRKKEEEERKKRESVKEEDIKSKYDELTVRYDEISSKYDDVNSKYNDLNSNYQTTLHKYSSMVKKIKDEKEDLQAENERLEAESRRFQRQVEEKEGLLKKALGEKEMVEMSLKTLTKSYKTLKESQPVVVEDSTPHLERIQGLEKKVKTLKEKVKHLEAQAHQLTLEKEEIHKENLTLLQAKLDDIFERESEFNTIKKNLQRENLRLLRENQRMEYELRAVSESSDDSNSGIEKIYALLEKEKKIRREAEQKVVEVESRNVILQNELDELSNRSIPVVEEKPVDLSELDSLLESINGVIEGFNTKYFTILEETRERLKKSQDENVKNMNNVTSLEISVEQSKALVDSLEKKNKDLLSLNSIHTRKMSNLLNDFDNVKIQNISLETEVQEKTKAVELYKEELAHLQGLVEEIQEKAREEMAILKETSQERVESYKAEYLQKINSLKGLESRTKQLYEEKIKTLLELEKKKRFSLKMENETLKKDNLDLEKRLTEEQEKGIQLSTALLQHELRNEDCDGRKEGSDSTVKGDGKDLHLSSPNTITTKEIVYVTDKQKLVDLERKSLIYKRELSTNRHSLKEMSSLLEKAREEKDSLRKEVTGLQSQLFELRKTTNTQAVILSQLQRELQDEKELISFLKPFSITRRNKK